MPGKCCVLKCKTNTKNGNKASIFSFPKDIILKSKWLRAIRRDRFTPTIHSKVCERHFSEDDIKRCDSVIDRTTGEELTAPYIVPRLHKGAVPSLLLGYDSDISQPPSPVKVEEFEDFNEVEEPKTEPEEQSLSFRENCVSSAPDFRSCCAPFCNTYSTDSKSSVKLFHFPLEANRCREWVRMVGNKDLARRSVKDLHYLKYLCAEHFISEDFTPRGYLKRTAVPLKFDYCVTPLSDEDLACFSTPIESEDSLSDIPKRESSKASAPELVQRRLQPRRKPATAKKKPNDENVALVEIVPQIVQVESKVSWEADDDNSVCMSVSSGDNVGNIETSEELQHQRDIQRTASTGSKQLTSVSRLQANHDRAKSYELLLEKVRKQLCRICGKKQEMLSPICSSDSSSADSEDELSLAKKLEMYLPLQVSKDDELPLNICSECHDAVELWHELHVSFLAADSLLRKMFFEKDMNILEDQSKETWPSEGNILVCEDSHKDPDFLDRIEDAIARNEEKAEESTHQQHDWGKDNSSHGPANDIQYISVVPPINPKLKWVLIPPQKPISVMCKFCNEVFSSKEEQSLHQKQCALEPTICHECGRSDIERGRLKRHLDGHIASTRIFMCDKCGRNLSSSYKLKCHIIAKHSGNRKPTYCCEACCRLFVNINSYRSHAWQHKKGKIKKGLNVEFVEHQGEGGITQYTCPVCQELFPDKISVVLHMRSRKKIKCTMCKAWMHSERDTLWHKCTFKTCRFCLKLFASYKNRSVHERTHTGEKPYSCRVCDARFISLTALGQHRLVHMPPQFKCEQCGKLFREKRNYTVHMEVHQGVRHKCTDCGKLCLTRKALLRHCKLVHQSC